MALDVVQDKEGRWVSKYLRHIDDCYSLCEHCNSTGNCRLEMARVVDAAIVKSVIFRCAVFQPKDE